MTLALIPGLGTVGPTELIMLLTIILLLFEVQRIPELARAWDRARHERRFAVPRFCPCKAAPVRAGLLVPLPRPWDHSQMKVLRRFE